MTHARVLALGFFVGAATMAAQLLGPRLVAPHLGTGLLTWSAVIATFLGGIAWGNRVGGLLADRGDARALPAGLGLAGLLCVATPLFDGLAQSVFGGLPHALRVPLSIALAFLPVSFALGLPGPMLAKALLGTNAAPGRLLGGLAAAGALGSVGGTFLTGFLLIPAYGTRSILLWVGASMALAAPAALRLPLGSRDDMPAPSEDTEEPEGASRAAHRFPRYAFLAGFALFTVEILAGRVAATHLGTSVFTWTAVIGVVLIGLSVGNVLGGRLADTRPGVPLLGGLFVVASAAVASGLWTPNLMAAVADGGGPWILRVALAVAAAFLLPALALGALSPVIARSALRDPGHDGRIVGRIYAAGTLGGIAGAVVTPYVLVPLLGVPVVLLLVALVLAGAAVPLRQRAELPWLVTLVLLAVLVRAPVDALRDFGHELGLREDVPGVYVDDSRYFHIVVSPYVREGEPPPGGSTKQRLRYMSLDRLVHGFVDLDNPMWLEYEYEQLYAAVVDRLWPERPVGMVRTCFIGGGTYTYQRRLLAQHGTNVRVTTLEIDPAVTRAAREALGLRSDPRHAIHHEDARTHLARSDDAFDFVFGDAFHDVGVPWHLTTKECAEIVKARLRKGARPGVYLVNIVDIYRSGRFLRAFLESLRPSFQHIVLLGMGPRDDDARQTFIVAASDGPLGLADLTDDRGEPLPAVTYDAWPAGLPGQGALTDDHAPVEALLAPVIRKRRMQDKQAPGRGAE